MSFVLLISQKTTAPQQVLFKGNFLPSLFSKRKFVDIVFCVPQKVPRLFKRQTSTQTFFLWTKIVTVFFRNINKLLESKKKNSNCPRLFQIRRWSAKILLMGRVTKSHLLKKTRGQRKSTSFFHIYITQNKLYTQWNAY